MDIAELLLKLEEFSVETTESYNGLTIKTNERITYEIDEHQSITCYLNFNYINAKTITVSFSNWFTQSLHPLSVSQILESDSVDPKLKKLIIFNINYFKS